MEKRTRTVAALVASTAFLAVAGAGTASAKTASGGLRIDSVSPLTVLGNTSYTFEGTVTGPKKCRGKRSVALLGANTGGPLSTLKTTKTAGSGAWILSNSERAVMLLKLAPKKVGSTKCPGTLLVGVIPGPLN